MRLSDQLTIKIKELIEKNGLQPGDKLPSERLLAEHFKVSRPPIREALRALASQGLIMTRASGGTYLQTELVNWPTQALNPLAQFIFDDPHYRYDVLEARLAIEKDTARLAALRATSKDKEKIQHYYDIMMRHQQLGENNLAAKADTEFHLAIVQASHNVVLLQIMRGLFNLLLTNVEYNRRTIFADKNPETSTALSQQHENLLHAILIGDATKAEQSVSQHLDFISSRQRRLDEDQARQQRATRTV